MLAVQTKGQADKISLASFMREAIVGKVSEFIGFEIEDRERLFSVRAVGAIAAVEKNSVSAVRRKSDGGGKIIDLAGMAGNFGQEFAVGKLSSMWRILRIERRCQADKKEKKMSAAAPSVIFHGESIKDFSHRNTDAVLARDAMQRCSWNPAHASQGD